MAQQQQRRQQEPQSENCENKWMVRKYFVIAMFM